MSGGLIGMNQVKKEFARLARPLKTILTINFLNPLNKPSATAGGFLLPNMSTFVVT